MIQHEVNYWNRTPLSKEEEQELWLTYLPFEELLQVSDYLSINVAYNEETFHLISEKEFELMKQTSINVYI